MTTSTPTLPLPKRRGPRSPQERAFIKAYARRMNANMVSVPKIAAQLGVTPATVRQAIRRKARAHKKTHAPVTSVKEQSTNTDTSFANVFYGAYKAVRELEKLGFEVSISPKRNY